MLEDGGYLNDTFLGETRDFRKDVGRGEWELVAFWFGR